MRDSATVASSASLGPTGAKSRKDATDANVGYVVGRLQGTQTIVLS